MARDPVCFAEVDEVDAEGQGLSSEQNNQTYFFCSEPCKERFDRDPGAFMGRTTDWEAIEEDRPDNFIG